MLDDNDENVTVLILVLVKIARWMIFCDNIDIVIIMMKLVKALWMMIMIMQL